MTKNRDFKTLVRQRMAKTGERYSTARAHVVAAATPTEQAGIAPTGAVGGTQPDLAAARNLCVNAGLKGPDGLPLSEALAFGLAGGVGFLYGVFEYGDTPTMTIVARNQSMPDPFCQTLFDRIGVAIEVTETTGAKKAATGLDHVLNDGRAALCTVGAGGLPYLGLPDDVSAMAPHLIGVYGGTAGGDRDGTRVWVDDRSPQLIPVPRPDLDAARAAYKPGKNRMVVIESVPENPDWPTIITSAVSEAAAGFDRPPVPQFKSNVGRAGLAKWAELLGANNQKSWRHIFGSDRRAAIGLSRLYDCVNHAYTSPDGSRPLFADFCDEAASIADEPTWKDAAELWRESGRQWRKISTIVTGAHPNIERYAVLSDERSRRIDEGFEPTTANNTDDIADDIADGPAAMQAVHQEQQDLIEGCDISAADATCVFDALADVVDTIASIESQALETMTGNG